MDQYQCRFLSVCLNNIPNKLHEHITAMVMTSGQQNEAVEKWLPLVEREAADTGLCGFELFKGTSSFLLLTVPRFTHYIFASLASPNIAHAFLPSGE